MEAMPNVRFGVISRRAGKQPTNASVLPFGNMINIYVVCMNPSDAIATLFHCISETGLKIKNDSRYDAL
jgi:hypothetical protein